MSESDEMRDPKAQAKADKAYKKASRPWFQKKRFLLIGAIGLFAVFSALSGGDSGSASSSSGSSVESSTETEATETAMVVTAQKLIEDLEANALAAATTYEGKLVTVTGELSNVDASGDYFSLKGTDDFSFTNVQIFINDDQVSTVAGYTIGQEVTVTGKVTDVGELLGYSIDAEKLG